MPGIGDLRAPAPDSPCRPAATRALGAPPVNHCERTGRASKPPAMFEGLPRQNAWAHAPARQRSHHGPTLCSPHNRRIGLAPLLGANPNPRLAHEGPVPHGLAPQRWGLWTPEPQVQTHTAAPLSPGPLEAPLVIQGRRMGRTLRARKDSRRPPAQKCLGPRPAHQLPHFGPHFRSPHSQRIRPACLLWPNPNPRSAPEGPLPRGLVPQCWGLETPGPQRRTHPVTPPPPGPLEALPVIQGIRTGRALRARGDSRKPTVPKRLGPHSCAPTASPRPSPLLAAQPADWACPPPGG